MDINTKLSNKSQVRKTKNTYSTHIYIFLVKFTAPLDIQWLYQSFCYSLYVVYSLQYLYHRLCQMKRNDWMPNWDGLGKTRRRYIYCKRFQRLPFSLNVYQAPFWSEIDFCAVWREIVGSDWHNWMLGARIVSLQPLRQLLCTVCASHLD
jgi:hypothetical protein